MLSIEEAKIRVARGAAHLDAQRPGWWNEIDIGTLTLHDPCGCIVGQLVGNFNEHLRSLGIRGATFACDYGLNLIGEWDHDTGKPLQGWRLLQDAWIAEIAARRCAQGDNGISDSPADGRGGLEETGDPVLTLRV